MMMNQNILALVMNRPSEMHTRDNQRQGSSDAQTVSQPASRDIYWAILTLEKRNKPEQALYDYARNQTVSVAL